MYTKRKPVHRAVARGLGLLLEGVFCRLCLAIAEFSSLPTPCAFSIVVPQGLSTPDFHRWRRSRVALSLANRAVFLQVAVVLPSPTHIFPTAGRCWFTFIYRATGLRAVEVRGEVLQTRVGHTLSGSACPS